MKITRVAPYLNGVEICVDENKNHDCFIKILGKSKFEKVEYREIRKNVLVVENLKNNIDYSIFFQETGKSSNRRFFRCGDYGGILVNYIHPDDMSFHPSGMCPASPSIIKLKSGRLLISHDIFFQNMKQNITKIHYSDNNGKEWNYLSTVMPCFWGKLFMHKDILYLLGHDGEYGDMLLYKSLDKGKTFEKPIVLIKGGDRLVGGPHKAPMPIIECNDRLWTAVDYGSWNLGGHKSGVISINVDDDLYNENNWCTSKFLKYDKNWDRDIDKDYGGLLEGNVVVKKDGSLINFLRYSTGLDYKQYGKAIYLNVNKYNANEILSFGKVIKFNGNISKFVIKYDIKTNRYWTIINRADEESVKKRNLVILMSSDDLDNWKDEKVLLDYTKWYEDYEQVAFQYIDFIFDKNKILYVSRTAINGALNYHDSNCITYHEVTYI